MALAICCDDGNAPRLRTGAGRIADIAVHPDNPHIWYVAVGSGNVFRTTNSGTTWTPIFDDQDAYSIACITLNPRDSDTVWLGTGENAAGRYFGYGAGVFRSRDGGESWENMGLRDSEHIGMIVVDPRDSNVVFVAAQGPMWSAGGASFERVPGEKKHVDHHAMAFRADDPNYLLVGNDGGLYESFHGGEHWKYVANLPITQFYKVSVDYSEPFYNIYAGAQDNSSLGGPSRTDNVVGIRNEDWFLTTGPIGHQSVADPTNPNIVYASWQQGSLSRYNVATGEMVGIQPQPGPGEPAERHNWDAPVLISPHNPSRLYHASYRVWRSDNRGDAWRLAGSLPGVPEGYFVNNIKADLHDADSVYVVVDDHKHGDYAPYVLRSTDRARSWRSISSNLPDRHIVWRLVQDHLKPELLFLGTEFGVFFSVDAGGSWTKLAGGAPNIPFRDLAIQQRENDLVGATFGRSIYVLDDFSPLRAVNAEILKTGATFFRCAARDGGVLVAPGAFEVIMQLRRDGELIVVGELRSVLVESIREPTLPGTSQEERVEFARKAVERMPMDQPRRRRRRCSSRDRSSPWLKRRCAVRLNRQCMPCAKTWKRRACPGHPDVASEYDRRSCEAELAIRRCRDRPGLTRLDGGDASVNG